MSEFLRKKWRLANPTLRDIIILCASMREDEIEQWKALLDPGPFDFEKSAVYLYQLPGVKFGLWCGDELIVCGGYYTTHGKVMRSWMVGTMDGWRKHWRSITEASRFVMECLIEDGATRLETEMLASRKLTAKWYEKGLGMQFEGILRGKGFRGEDIASFSRVVPATLPLAQELAHGRR